MSLIFTFPCSGFVSADFESGSIGEVDQKSDTTFNLSLKNDNDDPHLPSAWRGWWYVSLSDVSLDKETNISITNRANNNFYLPVYSYDNKKWFRFTEFEVSMSSNGDLTISKKFDLDKVWIARFYPYTYTKLQNYLNDVRQHNLVEVSRIGSTQQGRAIHMITVNDTSVDSSSKQRVWMHARAHPAEVGGSFVIEGLINYLLSDTDDAKAVLKKYIFNIVPMVNVDGVIAGNHYTTPKSEHLAIMWFRSLSDPRNLMFFVRPEIRAMHETILSLDELGPHFSVAINMHSSPNAKSNQPVYFFPHFGPEKLGYSKAESALYAKQVRFIQLLRNNYGNNLIAEPGDDGGSNWLNLSFPETWWWINYKEHVMALTMETVFGTGGLTNRWIEPEDQRQLGQSIAEVLVEY